MESLNESHINIVDKYLENVKNKTATHYMLTIARDGENPVRSILFYNNAIEASNAYDLYQDAGFAKQYLTVCLYEPSGVLNKKIIKRDQAGDPSFVRQNYIDVTNILKKHKNSIDPKIFQDISIQMAQTFGKDNWRFDAERFLRNLEIDFKFDF